MSGVPLGFRHNYLRCRAYLLRDCLAMVRASLWIEFEAIMSRIRIACRLALRSIGLHLGLAACATVLQAAEPQEPCGQRISDRSAHFLIHTDLSQDDTTKVLERMEAMLSRSK